MLTIDELEDRLIDLSFAEDIGDGDHTTLCCIPADAMGKSRLLIKEDGILAGVEVATHLKKNFLWCWLISIILCVIAILMGTMSIY